MRRPSVLRRRAAPHPPQERTRAREGPLVSDDTWRADQAFIEEHLRPHTVAGKPTELIDLGEGDPVVCVPILGHVEIVYARQLRDLCRDRRVLLYRRPEATRAPVGIAERVEEVRDLLDGLDIESADVIGRGEGAIVASGLALAHPERCRSLVMVNLGMLHKVPPVLLTTALNRALLHLPIEGRLLTDESWRHKVCTYLSGPDQRLTYEQLDEVYRRIPEFIRVCKYSVTPLVLHHDLRGRAQRLPTPTLLITTDEDPRATATDLEELGAALPDCRGVHVVPHGGRFVNYIQGDAVNALIRAFYGELATDRPRARAGLQH